MTNYYDTLEVGRKASQKEIKDAYRRLARKLHPDVNHGNKHNQEQFKRVNEAYDVLSKPDLRKDYDEFGDEWRHAKQIRDNGGFGGQRHHFRSQGGHSTFNFSDIFGDTTNLFGGSSTPMETEATISLQEAYKGTRRRVDMQTPMGVRSIDVKIPAGVADNSRVVVYPNGVKVHLRVKIKLDDRFQRKGSNLHVNANVALKTALFGGEATVDTLSGRVLLKIPADTQNGKVFKLRGKGMPILNSKEFGDLLVHVVVDLPVPLSEEAKVAMQQALGEGG